MRRCAMTPGTYAIVGGIVCGAFLLTPRDARAQATIVVSDIEFYAQRAGGDLVGCGIELNLVFRDFVTSASGKLTGVRGSLMFGENRGNVMIMMKMVGVDFPNPTTPVPFTPSAIYLSVDGKPVSMTRGGCEDRRYACGATWLPDSGMVYMGLDRGKVAVNMNREPGGFDVSLPLDISTAMLKHPDQYGEFSKCMGVLLKRAAGK